MLLLLVMTAAIAYNALSTIRDSQDNLVTRDLAGIVNIVELRSDLNRQRVYVLEMMLTQDRASHEIRITAIQDYVERINQRLQELASLYQGNTEYLFRLDEIKAMLEAYGQTREEIIRLIFAGKIKEARQTVDSIQAERYETIRSIAIDIEQVMKQQISLQITASNDLVIKSTRLFVILGALALALSIILTVILTNLVSRPLVKITQAARQVASGDLSESLVAEQRTDEIGELSQAFIQMADSLRMKIGALTEGANVLGSAANEIVAATSQLSVSASESAAAVSETTTTVEEVRQTVHVASEKAKLVSSGAQKAAQSTSGRKSIEDVSSGMERIRQQMDAIAISMVRLSEQSQAIGQIMASVEDLAAQSNLLAVNAAIEAAKAGEHGKGFGVVAQEVKSLAEQSRQATHQVRTILGDIQKATTTAVMATEQGAKAVEAGTRQTETAGEAIQALAASVQEAAQASTQIAASSQQQLIGIDQVAAAMESIKHASTQNMVSAQQLEAAAGNLNELGQRLKSMVERYKV